MSPRLKSRTPNFTLIHFFLYHLLSTYNVLRYVLDNTGHTAVKTIQDFAITELITDGEMGNKK
jgi:hypothetical protein